VGGRAHVQGHSNAPKHHIHLLFNDASESFNNKISLSEIDIVVQNRVAPRMLAKHRLAFDRESCTCTARSLLARQELQAQRLGENAKMSVRDAM
jgi:hypothetical protein